MKYLLLDGFGDGGWNAASMENLEAKRSSLRLAPLPSPAVSLIDAGLGNPVGVAVAANGDIYCSDTATHRIFRVRMTTPSSAFGTFSPKAGEKALAASCIFESLLPFARGEGAEGG